MSTVYVVFKSVDDGPEDSFEGIFALFEDKNKAEKEVEIQNSFKEENEEFFLRDFETSDEVSEEPVGMRQVTEVIVLQNSVELFMCSCLDATLPSYSIELIDKKRFNIEFCETESKSYVKINLKGRGDDSPEDFGDPFFCSIEEGKLVLNPLPFR